MGSEDKILHLDHLKVGYGSTQILPEIDLRLDRGCMVSLLGSNGAGKSTLLRTIGGAQHPLGGKILIDGKDTSRCSATELARIIALVYTDRIAAGGLTVEQVVALGRYPHISALGRLRATDRRIVDEALALVGISHFAKRYMSRLSDGERQKVMIARAIAQDSPIIILDEPTTFLDVASRLEIFRLLRRLSSEHDKTIIISTHEVAPAIATSDRVWLITYNRQVHDGTPEELIDGGEIDKMFAPGQNIRFSREASDFVLN